MSKDTSWLQKLEEKFGAAVVSASESGSFPFLEIKKEEASKIFAFLKEDPTCKMDAFECLIGNDEEKDFVLIYQLHSSVLGKNINIKMRLDHSKPETESVKDFWPAARLYEVEVTEMLGVVFKGNASQKRLFLPTEWEGYPLRKDYIFPKEFMGIEHHRPPERKEHPRP